MATPSDEKITGIYGASKWTMEECIEAIADAVLQVVLFQVEADENASTLINPFIKPLVEAIGLLVELAKAKANQWVETEEVTNREVMLRDCMHVAEEGKKIDKSLQRLLADDHDQDAKERLMWSCKETLIGVIRLLQKADAYDIRRICRGVKTFKKETDEGLCLSPADAQDYVRRYIFTSVSLAKHTLDRRNYIVDPVLKERFEQCNATIKTRPEQYIKACFGHLAQPSNADLTRAVMQLKDVMEKACDEIISTAEESSKNMFIGLLVDLDPINRDNYVNLELNDQENFGSVLGRMQSALDKLDHAAKQAAFKKSMEAMKEIEILDDLCSGYVKANAFEEGGDIDEIKAAQDHLHSCVLAAKEALRRFLDDPNNLEAKDALVSAIAAASQASRHLFSLCFPPELDGCLSSAAARVHAALRNLQSAAVKKDKDRAVVQAKEAVAALREQGVEAGKVAETTQDPHRAKLLRQTVDKIDPLLRALLQAVKDHVGDPANPVKLQALLDEIERAKALSYNLSMLTQDIKAPVTLDSLTNRIAELAHSVDRRLVDFGTGGFGELVPTLAKSLKAVSDELGQASVLAQQFADQCGDDSQKGRIEEAVSRVSPTLKELIEACRHASTRLNDGDAVCSLGLKVDQARRLVHDLVDVCSPLFGMLASCAASMRGEVGSLKSAVDAADRAGAQRSAAEAGRLARVMDEVAADVARQFGLDAGAVARAAAGVTDGSKAVGTELEGALKTGKGAAQEAYKGKADGLAAAAQRLADEVLRQLPIQYSEGVLLDNAVNVHRNLSAMQADLEKQDGERAELHAYLAKKGAETQAAVAEMLAGRSGMAKTKKDTLMKAGNILHSNTASWDDAVAAARAGQPQLLQLAMQDVRTGTAMAMGACGNTPGEKLHCVAVETQALMDELDPSPSVAGLCGVRRGLEQQCLLAQLVVDNEPQVSRKRAVESRLHDLKQKTAEYDRAAVTYLGDSSDASNRKSVEDALQAASAASAQLVATALPLEARIKANSAALLDKLKRLDKGVADAREFVVRPLHPEVNAHISEHINLCREVALSCPNKDHQRELLLLCEQCGHIRSELHDQCLPSLSNASLRKPCCATIGSLQGVVAKMTDCANKAAHAEEPNTLEGAAITVEKKAKTLIVDDTPKGRMYFCVQQIAEQMRIMCEAAKANRKRDMIKAAQTIAGLVKDIVELAKQHGTGCSDMRTVNELVSMAYAAKNFSVQLKIVAAVKASTSDDDPAAEAQLVTCAKGLAKSVVSCCDLAEVVDVKKKGSSIQQARHHH